MSKSHISYFQSVMTLGILTDGESIKESEKKALNKIQDGNVVDHCFFDQTPFEIVATEAWIPELQSERNREGLSFDFNPSDKTKNVIATRLHKKTHELTNEDLERFVKESLQMSLEKTN